MMRRTLIACIGFMLCAFAPPIPEGFEQVGERGAIVHTASAIYFPDELGDMKSSTELVQSYSPRHDNVTVGYHYFSPGRPATLHPDVTATIYISPLPAYADDAAINQALLADINKAHNGSMKELATYSTSIQCGTHVIQGLYDKFRVQWTPNTAKFPQGEVYLFVRKPWLFQVRFVNEDEYTKITREFVQQFFNENVHNVLCN